MKHAGAGALQALAPLLAELRRLPGLVERKPGIFYAAGKACLHFHEDPAGLFADLRCHGTDFERFAVDTPEQRRALLAAAAARQAPE